MIYFFIFYFSDPRIYLSIYNKRPLFKSDYEQYISIDPANGNIVLYSLKEDCLCLAGGARTPLLS